tara:strand:+ start:1695 stop:1898 length:204 start_codon:yes stop_codon:yes gene_type:complete
MKKIIPVEPDWERVVRWLNEEISIKYRIVKNKKKKIENLDINKEILEIEQSIRVRNFLLRTKLLNKL